MKTSKWNLATLPCPLCPAHDLSSVVARRRCCNPRCVTRSFKCGRALHPACALPALHPALPLALALALAMCCPAPKRSEPKPCPALPSPFFSKSCKNVILRFSGLENLKMESCNPALPFVPCPCTLPAPCPFLSLALALGP